MNKINSKITTSSKASTYKIMTGNNLRNNLKKVEYLKESKAPSMPPKMPIGPTPSKNPKNFLIKTSSPRFKNTA